MDTNAAAVGFGSGTRLDQFAAHSSTSVVLPFLVHALVDGEPGGSIGVVTVCSSRVRDTVRLPLEQFLFDCHRFVEVEYE
ncbi:MAG: hypothetical protein M5U30_14695 [Burkholderiaceae bacterium]|nr:hypothetical protein [Burkholderiaceae bacterium]